MTYGTTTLDAGAGGDGIAHDDVGGEIFQRSKLAVGAEGVAVDVSAANPIPATAASLPLPAGAATSAAQLPDGHAVTVDNASIAVTAAALPLPSGAATEATSAAILVDTAAMDTNIATVAGAVSGTEIQADVITQPARAATTDTIAVALMTNVLHDGTTALTPKDAKLSTASTGNQALVAAVAGKTTRVVALQVICAAGTNAIYINDGTADLYGDATIKIPLDVTGATGSGGFTLPFNPLGWFETGADNRPININLGSANGVIAIAKYVEV